MKYHETFSQSNQKISKSNFHQPTRSLTYLSLPSHYSPQVIEISGVSEHLLTECESSDKFAQCPRCKEAIPKEDLNEHFAEKSCQGKYL